MKKKKLRKKKKTPMEKAVEEERKRKNPFPTGRPMPIGTMPLGGALR
jgi:hypothetical protein